MIRHTWSVGVVMVIKLVIVFAVVADMCTSTSGVGTAITPTPTASDSLSDPPGSCATTFYSHIIPDGRKWYPIAVNTSHRNTACPSRDEQIVELRGWIHPDLTSAGSNTLGKGSDCDNDQDPDWHYQLEVDSAWAARQGMDLNQLLRVGNLNDWPLNSDNHSNGSYHLDDIPMIHMELWGWKPSDHPGQPRPTGWKSLYDWTQGAGTTGTVTPGTKSAVCPDVVWPYNPQHPSGHDLFDGEYVRVVGSLVTDDSHDNLGDWTTGFSKVQGFPDEQCEQCTISRVDSYDAPDSPARWTEIHPPDLIVGLPDPGRAETLHGIALFAHECLIGSCETQTIDEDIIPPTGCPTSAPHVGYQELVGMGPGESSLSSIIAGNGAGPGGSSTGAQITVHSKPDYIHIHIAIQGKSPNGGNGRFKALYRVYCTA